MASWNALRGPDPARSPWGPGPGPRCPAGGAPHHGRKETRWGESHRWIATDASLHRSFARDGKGDQEASSPRWTPPERLTTDRSGARRCRAGRVAHRFPRQALLLVTAHVTCLAPIVRSHG